VCGGGGGGGGAAARGKRDHEEERRQGKLPRRWLGYTEGALTSQFRATLWHCWEISDTSCVSRFRMALNSGLSPWATQLCSSAPWRTCDAHTRGSPHHSHTHTFRQGRDSPHPPLHHTQHSCSTQGWGGKRAVHAPLPPPARTSVSAAVRAGTLSAVRRMAPRRRLGRAIFSSVLSMYLHQRRRRRTGQHMLPQHTTPQ
jgi:hypothetical protein